MLQDPDSNIKPSYKWDSELIITLVTYAKKKGMKEKGNSYI